MRKFLRKKIIKLEKINFIMNKNKSKTVLLYLKMNVNNLYFLFEENMMKSLNI
jgi:hypothetical protein